MTTPTPSTQPAVVLHDSRALRAAKVPAARPFALALRTKPLVPMPSAVAPSRASGRDDPARPRLGEPEPRRIEEPAIDPLDPSSRRLSQLAPPLAFSFQPAAPTTAPAPARVSMEELVPQLVRRIAWSGDRRRGSVQLELGGGPHAGTIVTVHADDGRVRVELDGPGSAALRARIHARLERHGLVVDSVT